MKQGSIRFLALASLALLAMTTSANSATILVYGQTNTSTEVVTANSSGGTTTFHTGPDSATVPITVGITNIGGVTPPPGTTLPETFTFTSTAPVTGSGGNFTQGGFSGTFSFGTQVIGTVTGGILNTTVGPTGTTGSFQAPNATFTTLGPGILAQLGIPGVGAVAGGTLSISLGTFSPTALTSLNFSARNSGLVDANAVPEPASVVMASISVIAGLGLFGLRRFNASRA